MLRDSIIVYSVTHLSAAMDEMTIFHWLGGRATPKFHTIKTLTKPNPGPQLLLFVLCIFFNLDCNQATDEIGDKKEAAAGAALARLIWQQWWWTSAQWHNLDWWCERSEPNTTCGVSWWGICRHKWQHMAGAALHKRQATTWSWGSDGGDWFPWLWWPQKWWQRCLIHAAVVKGWISTAAFWKERLSHTHSK